MRIRLSILVLCLVLPACLFAQDKPQPTTPPGVTQDQMEAMMKLMGPGEPHKFLARMVGQWAVTTRAWMAPGQAPAESSGTMNANLILGGRYVESHWKGEIMGMPFEGRGTDGYDNVAKQYVSSWVDNMGTGILYQTGTCDASHKSCTFTGDMWDPATGRKTTFKSVLTWVDEDSFKNEMFGKDASGNEQKMMEITAKRQ